MHFWRFNYKRAKNGPKGHTQGNFALQYLRKYTEFRKTYAFSFVLKNDAEYNTVISVHQTRVEGSGGSSFPWGVVV